MQRRLSNPESLSNSTPKIYGFCTCDSILVDGWLLQSLAPAKFSHNQKSHPLCRSPNPGKNVREAVCVGDQEEDTLENEKGCALEIRGGNGREGFDFL